MALLAVWLLCVCVGFGVLAQLWLVVAVWVVLFDTMFVCDCVCVCAVHQAMSWELRVAQLWRMR